jgi:hypothetical protein
MRTTVRALTSFVGVIALAVANAAAQDQAAPKVGMSVPVRIQLVISRFQGDKKISAAPFTFICGEDQGSRIRMGVEVPITTVPPAPEGKQNVPGVPPVTVAPGPPPMFQYRPFGTNIDCMLRPLDNGRFKVSITVEESAPYSAEDKSRLAESTNTMPAVRANPVFRSMRMSDVLLLKDGQSEQMSSATDRFSGEVVKVDVTLSVVK